jgi:predicted N-acyltransferase
MAGDPPRSAPADPISGDSALEIALQPGLEAVSPLAWDALAPPDDPFVTHAFLSALEDSGSVGAAAGWQPAHVLVRYAGRLVAAAPCYVKDHSYGEYIFDWGWARAAQQAGLPYYPKVVCAVPFTPAQGRRLLVHPDAGSGGLPSADVLEEALWRGMRALADTAECWSVHVLFCGPEEKAHLGSLGAIPRLTHQFHWTNEGYDSFDDWTARFRSKLRKETNRERRRPAQLGATVRVLEGDAITAAHWDAIEGYYRDTCERKWGQAYLSPDFFALARARLAHLAMGIVAEVEGRVVASALLFQRGQHLYGRYWGCDPAFEQLHFELCYHRPIELCIERGWSRFEAGAQGTHKLRRGLMPAQTHSAHWLRHPGLERAVREALGKEDRLVALEMEKLAEHGPFRRD